MDVSDGFEELRARIDVRRSAVLHDARRAGSIEVFSRLYGVPHTSVMDHLAQHGCTLVAADAALFGIIDRDGVRWHGSAHCSAPRTLPRGELLAEWGAIIGAPLLFDDATGFPAEFVDVAALGWRGAAAMPLLNEGVAVGTLLLGRIGGASWREQDRRALDGWMTMNAILNNRRAEAVAEAAVGRVEADARFGTIFERAPMGIVLVDDVGRFETVNTAFAELAGVPREALVGRPVREIAIPIEGDQTAVYLQEMLAGKRRAYTAERNLLQPDGSSRLVRVTTAQLRYRPDGKASHLAIIEDVTHQRAAERALRDREEQLRQAQKMEAIGQLAGGLAHDFSNTLAAIAGFASLLQDEIPADDPRRRDVDGILRVTQDASTITRKLLTISKKQVQERAALDMRSVVTDFATLVRPVLPATIEYRTILPDSPVFAMIDRTQMEQVLLNLSLNARDAMQGGGALTIAVTKGEATLPGLGVSAVARIAVRDDGTGMDSDVASRLWEPFFTTKARGSGLGLPMSLAILREHGGDLRVESELGQGSTFTLLIPLAETGAAGHRDSAPGGISLNALSTGQTVLLVEDENAVRVTSQRLLQRAGFTVYVAADGMDAWRQFLANIDNVDIVVTDLMMPELTGRELVQRIRANVPDMPVVITSAYSPDDGHDAETAGTVDATLVKPFTGTVLVQTVREVLATRQRRDRMRPPTGQ